MLFHWCCATSPYLSSGPVCCQLTDNILSQFVKWACMCRHLGGEACNLVGIAIRQPSQARCTLAVILIRGLPLDLCLFATWLSEELPKKGKPCPLVA